MNTMENIGYVFSGVRHEVGNPVNNVKMILSILRSRLETCPKEKVQEYVDRALCEISRAEYILKALRSCSLYEEPEIRSVDLEDFLDRFLSLVREDLRRKCITLTVNSAPGQVTAAADARFLQQALLNVITNAADALANQENAEVSVTVGTDESSVNIAIRDNGCGMTAEQQQLLFKPFCTSKPHGTGLGLFLVRKMILRMHGYVAVSSESGRGTTVVLSLPAGSKANA